MHFFACVYLVIPEPFIETILLQLNYICSFVKDLSAIYAQKPAYLGVFLALDDSNLQPGLRTTA